MFFSPALLLLNSETNQERFMGKIFKSVPFFLIISSEERKKIRKTEKGTEGSKGEEGRKL